MPVQSVMCQIIFCYFSGNISVLFSYLNEIFNVISVDLGYYLHHEHTYTRSNDLTNSFRKSIRDTDLIFSTVLGEKVCVRFDHSPLKT